MGRSERQKWTLPTQRRILSERGPSESVHSYFVPSGEPGNYCREGYLII